MKALMINNRKERIHFLQKPVNCAIIKFLKILVGKPKVQ